VLQSRFVNSDDEELFPSTRDRELNPLVHQSTESLYGRNLAAQASKKTNLINEPRE
jgi:hypothetical protein